jgi:phospholipid/cholesterol/gamma-HCH transport system substrate-binding protein
MKRANDFIVGLTIIVTTVILIGAVLWVQQSDLGQKRRTITARFRDVGSVRVGAQVVIRGVKSGRVQALELAPNGWVEARLALDPTAELPANPVVLLNESSLFGEWQATILGREALPRDENVARQIAEADQGGGRIPGATLPDIAQLTAVAGRIAGDVATVAERVEVAFDDRAARELRASIKNFAELSSVLAATVKEQSRNLHNMSADVQGGVNSLVAASQDVKAISARFDSSTARGEVRQIVEDAATAAKELRETSRRLLTISGQLGASEERLHRFIANSDSVMVKINRGDGSLGLLVNDPALYRNADSTLRELQALIGDMRRNPKKYVNVRIF